MSNLCSRIFVAVVKNSSSQVLIRHSKTKYLHIPCFLFLCHIALISVTTLAAYMAEQVYSTLAGAMSNSNVDYGGLQRSRRSSTLSATDVTKRRLHE
jgi:hypothetical protein